MVTKPKSRGSMHFEIIINLIRQIGSVGQVIKHFKIMSNLNWAFR